MQKYWYVEKIISGTSKFYLINGIKKIVHFGEPVLK